MFNDKLSIIVALLGIFIASAIGITSYYKDQPLINFFINILLVFGIYYLLLAVLLVIVYKNKLKKQKELEEAEKKKSESESNSFPFATTPSLFRNRFRK